MNVSKCILLISELFEGGWGTNSTEQPISGPPLHIMTPEHILLWMALCCPWRPWQQVGSHQAPCFFNEEIDTLKGQVPCFRSTQLSETEPKLNSSPAYKLRVIPLVPESSSLNLDGRGLRMDSPKCALESLVPLPSCPDLSVEEEIRASSHTAWNDNAPSAQTCGLEPSARIHYLLANVILTRNSWLGDLALSGLIQPSATFALPVWDAPSTSHSLGLLQRTPKTDPLNMDVQLFKQLPASPLLNHNLIIFLKPKNAPAN